jgi:hypothetical protein
MVLFGGLLGVNDATSLSDAIFAEARTHIATAKRAFARDVEVRNYLASLVAKFPQLA